MNPFSRGDRLHRVRNLANLDRNQICDEGNINLHTFKGWEVGRHGGLTKKGAEKIINLVAKHGVICSLDWLLYDIGSGPKVYSDHDKNIISFVACQPDKLPVKNELELIAKELALFRCNYKNTIDFIVDDEGMLPHYHVGDYVAGIRRFGKGIQSVVGRDCIVQTKNGEQLFRHVRAGNGCDVFNLMCNNAAENIAEPVIYNMELVSAAPVIWHRSREIK